MRSDKKYRNPPISEAVCEIRIVPGTPWDLAVPGMIYDRLKGRFPKRRQVKTVEATLIGGAVRMQESERLQFLQEDERALIVVGKDVLSVSRLKPYLGWEAFLPLILEAFEAYKEITTPTGFQRLGLRYINQLNFKEERLKLEDFFDFYPYVGKQLPQDHGTFVTGIQLAYEDGRDAIRLQFASAEAAPGFRLSLILDLDYFSADSAKIAVVDLEPWLKNAHARLGETFEGCLKESARRLFQEA
jgi:uncharacterized protein (TIGR04255 family)